MRIVQGVILHINNIKNTPQLWDRRFHRNLYLQAVCVCNTPIAHITGCVLIEDVSQRLPLELQCSSYQGQQEVMLISLCAKTIKKVFEGDKTWQLWQDMLKNTYIVYIYQFHGRGGYPFFITGFEPLAPATLLCLTDKRDFRRFAGAV